MDIETTLETYCVLMEVIKMRTKFMVDLANKPEVLPGFSVAEIIQLQIRMICETLAMACLVAHGDIEGARTNRLASAYQADFIMNALEKLHPRFYPRATKQLLRPDGSVGGMEDIKDGFLTKAALLKSYHDAGDFLHVGSLSDIEARKQRRLDTNTVAEWTRKIGILLSHHNIFLADQPGETPIGYLGTGEPAPRRQIIVIMQPQNLGRPQATLFETVGPAPRPPDLLGG